VLELFFSSLERIFMWDPQLWSFFNLDSSGKKCGSETRRRF